MASTMITPPSPDPDRPGGGTGGDGENIPPYGSGGASSLGAAGQTLSTRSSNLSAQKKSFLDAPGDSQDGPFNFTPMSMAAAPVTKQNIGQRRGHKYKHSSVSHQIFLEPTPRAPLSLPSSLPIPSLKECWRSMTTNQSTRLYWSACHAAIAAFILYASAGSLALTALSHLVFFDSLGAMLCVVVDVLGNFEVWKRSTIRHPFGMQRAEVLSGFAMSVLLLFMGFDLISHNLQHMLEGAGGHEPHVEHDHERISPGGVDITVFLAVLSTVVSALVLRNHARIGKVMPLAYLEGLPGLLSNPSHLLTIVCSVVLLVLPFLALDTYNWMDKALSIGTAMAMCLLGGMQGYTLGRMLLMSSSTHGFSDVLQGIEGDPHVVSIVESKFWMAHYGLSMANLKLRVRCTEDEMPKLRDKLSSLVKNRLGGGYGTGGMKWEVTSQLIREGD